MNRLLYISFLLITVYDINAVNADKVERAIEDSSMSNVKSALSRFDREEMKPEMRKKYLRDFAQAAADVAEQRAKNCSIIGNRSDITKSIFGISLALAGSYVLKNITFNPLPIAQIGNAQFYYESVLDKLMKYGPRYFFGLGLLTCGCYSLYRGLGCSTQKEMIAQAESIEKFLQDKIANVDSNEGVLQGTAPIDTDKISKAIEDSSIDDVKLALTRFEREAMTSQMLKKYYKDFAQAATGVTEQKTKSCSIFGNGWDIAKTASGGALFLAGIMGSAGAVDLLIEQGNNDNDAAGLLIALSLYMLINGSVLLYAGLSCSTQRAGITRAKAVEKYLHDKCITTDWRCRQANGAWAREE